MIYEMSSGKFGVIPALLVRRPDARPGIFSLWRKRPGQGNLLKPGYSRLLSIFPRAMYAGAWLLGPIPLQTGFRLYWPRILVRAENSSKPERKALAPSVNQRPERQSPLHFVAPWAGLNMSKGSGQTFILFVARINNGANEESPELFR